MLTAVNRAEPIEELLRISPAQVVGPLDADLDQLAGDCWADIGQGAQVAFIHAPTLGDQGAGVLNKSDTALLTVPRRRFPGEAPLNTATSRVMWGWSA